MCSIVQVNTVNKQKSPLRSALDGVTEAGSHSLLHTDQQTSMNTRSLYLPDLMRQGITDTIAIKYDLTDGDNGASVVGAAHVAAGPDEAIEAIQAHLVTTKILGTRVPDTWIKSSEEPQHLKKQLGQPRSLLYVISALNDYTPVGREEIVGWLEDELDEDLLTVEVSGTVAA